MLRLTRKVGQAIVVTLGGVRFTIKVSDIDRNKVGLAFDAPGTVAINRGEVQAAIDAIAAGRLADAK